MSRLLSSPKTQEARRFCVLPIAPRRDVVETIVRFRDDATVIEAHAVPRAVFSTAARFGVAVLQQVSSAEHTRRRISAGFEKDFEGFVPVVLSAATPKAA